MEPNPVLQRLGFSDRDRVAIIHAEFAPAYIQLALEHGLPPMFLRLDEAGWREVGLDAETAALAAQFVHQLESQGVPLLDNLAHLPLDQPGDRLALAKEIIDSLPAGITHLIIHPAQDTPELRAIMPASWQYRVADYDIFRSQALRDHVRDSGVQVIGYRAVRGLMS